MIALFPFLIGKVLTKDDFKAIREMGQDLKFPFLIGKVLTFIKGKNEKLILQTVSIPYR